MYFKFIIHFTFLWIDFTISQFLSSTSKKNKKSIWPLDESIGVSELNFHILNANSQSFARAKSETKMAAHGGKFCTSISVLFVVLYVSSSLLHDFNFQFLFGSTSKTFTTMEKVHRRDITGPVLHIRVLKRIRYCHVAKEMS